jgi:hypothetical protein
MRAAIEEAAGSAKSSCGWTSAEISRKVMRAVVAPRHQCEVLQSVVGLILVNVVQNLTAHRARVARRTPHNNVLVCPAVWISERVTLTDAHLDVAGGAYTAAGLPAVLARCFGVVPVFTAHRDIP